MDDFWLWEYSFPLQHTNQKIYLKDQTISASLFSTPSPTIALTQVIYLVLA